MDLSSLQVKLIILSLMLIMTYDIIIVFYNLTSFLKYFCILVIKPRSKWWSTRTLSLTYIFNQLLENFCWLPFVLRHGFIKLPRLAGNKSMCFLDHVTSCLKKILSFSVFFVSCISCISIPYISLFLCTCPLPLKAPK